MEYVKFTEHNMKENETYVFYLQYTGNKIALKKLNEAIHATNRYTLDGDTSWFELDLGKRYPYNSVNLHCGFDENVERVDGRFEAEFYLEGKTQHEIATDLDNMFYHGRIVNYFKHDGTD
jgi:hypothetical protein